MLGVKLDSLKTSRVIETVPAFGARSKEVNDMFKVAPDIGRVGANVVYMSLYYPEFEGSNGTDNGIPCYAITKGEG